jgi:hypothetical protein
MYFEARLIPEAAEGIDPFRIMKAIVRSRVAAEAPVGSV